MINIEKIINMIPHRYPLLLVDKVVDFEKDKYAEGIKNVTFNEPHFQGHFPGKPIMPGVLIIEAMAQTSALLVVESQIDSPEEKLVYFMSIEKTKFRKPVVPGDTLHLKVSTIQSRGAVWKFEGKAYVEDNLVAEAVFSAMIIDK